MESEILYNRLPRLTSARTTSFRSHLLFSNPYIPVRLLLLPHIASSFSYHKSSSTINNARLLAFQNGRRLHQLSPASSGIPRLCRQHHPSLAANASSGPAALQQRCYRVRLPFIKARFLAHLILRSTVHTSRSDRRHHLTVRLYRGAKKLTALHFYFSRKVCIVYSVAMTSLTFYTDPQVRESFHQESLERHAV